MDGWIITSHKFTVWLLILDLIVVNTYQRGNWELTLCWLLSFRTHLLRMTISNNIWYLYFTLDFVYFKSTNMMTNTIYWCIASNLKALRNMFMNEKKSICVWVYLFAIYVVIYVYIFMYRRGFFIVQLFRPWLRHNGLQNLIRALHCMVNSNSYVRIHVKIINL